jgi:multisubunit Na+/H+ antiporter MnhB subunit
MHYDQSWMGYGWIGGLQAGLIAAVTGALLFLLFRWRTRKAWSHGAQMAWAYVLGVALAASGDLADLFYFNYARLQSVQLLRAKLAEVHDPDGLGTRVLCELAGVAAGIAVAWLASEWAARRR